MSIDVSTAVSGLPSITRLLARPEVVDAVAQHGHDRVVAALRGTVDAARAAVLAGGAAPAPDVLVAEALAVLAARDRHRTQRVVNATGVVLHTNLGRAPLSPAAARAVQDAAGYTNLEYDLGTGGRGGRGTHAAALLAEACRADAALVVNNGAAGLVLVLAALAGDSHTVVSRGELVEIGGAFRLPDVMAASGTHLVEVGTTNRTHLADYAAVLDDHDVALVLQVHPSNFRVVGFTARPSTTELAEAAHAAGVPLVVDIGSGLLDDDAALADEPVAASTLADGADLVVFSGDKLLGGPQAGVVAGRSDLVARCRSHPLARALRVDKLRLAALEATVAEHLAGRPPPARAMLATEPDLLQHRATGLAARARTDVVAVTSVAGGGSLPDAHLPSWAVALDGAADPVLDALRAWCPPVVGRIVDGRVVLDVRTLTDGDEDVVVAAIHDLQRRGLAAVRLPDALATMPVSTPAAP